MNWISEAHKSWEWLQWMREVVGEDVGPLQTLAELIRGMEQWDDAIARDRHATGDPNRIADSEYFLYAASMMSREAKTAIEGALTHAITWGVDDPMTWSSLPAEAKEHWADAHHVVTNVLQAWITLWNDLAAFQGQIEGTAEQQVQAWEELADQAAETVAGLAVAAWAQCR